MHVCLCVHACVCMCENNRWLKHVCHDYLRLMLLFPMMGHLVELRKWAGLHYHVTCQEGGTVKTNENYRLLQNGLALVAKITQNYRIAWLKWIH